MFLNSIAKKKWFIFNNVNHHHFCVLILVNEGRKLSKNAVRLLKRKFKSFIWGSG